MKKPLKSGLFTYPPPMGDATEIRGFPPLAAAPLKAAFLM